MSDPTTVSDLDPNRRVVVCNGGRRSKGAVKVHLTDEKWCTGDAQTDGVLAGALYEDQEVCEICLKTADTASDTADYDASDDRDTVLTDGGVTGEVCASCTAWVAREGRVTVDGQIYHRQCAPDTGAYDAEVPR